MKEITIDECIWPIYGIGVVAFVASLYYMNGFALTIACIAFLVCSVYHADVYKRDTFTNKIWSYIRSKF